MREIKVSIIVAFYNTEQYARACLDSLVSQSLKEIEIICVNDASPDGVLSLLREYEEKYREKIIVIDSQVNLKLGGARNLGIKAARGEYIAFVDSDDYVDFTMYEKLYNKAREDNFDIVSANYFLSFQDKNVLKDIADCNILKERNALKRKKSFMAVAFPALWARIYKKSLWFDNKVFFPENVYFEDAFVYPLLFYYSKKIACINEPLYYYVQREGSIMNNARIETYIRDHLIVADKLLKEARERKIYLDFKEEFNFYIIKLVYFQTLVGLFFRSNKLYYSYMNSAAENTKKLLGKAFLKNIYVNKNKILKLILILNEYFRPLLYILFLIFKPISKSMFNFIKARYKWKT